MFPSPRRWLSVGWLLSSFVATNALSLTPRATSCNGFSELCDKSYGSVSYVGAHNSYAVGTNNLATNQDYDVTQQLNDGVRLLQLQVHNNNNVLQLCHSSCSLFNGGTLEDYLKKVKSWLDANTDHVVTILIVNIDNLPPSQFGTVYTSAGMDSVSFAPESSPLTASAWPTLGSMIDSGKRVVTFLDNQADPAAVPYLIDEFTNVWETAFDVTDISLFDCSVNRTKGDSSTQLYLINHFLDKIVFGQPAPDVSKANTTNAASGDGSLGAHVQTCQSSVGRPPTFLLVDFYEYGGGSVFQVAAGINGVTYNPTTPVATPLPQTSGSSSPSSTGNTATSYIQFVPDRRQWLSFVAVMCGVMFGAVEVV